jgi:Fe2+ transport system protein B
MFAKEAVVGTLDALYSEKSKDNSEGPADVTDKSAVAEEQDVDVATLSNMAALFGTPLAAFCYLIFILLYAPYVAQLL